MDRAYMPTLKIQICRIVGDKIPCSLVAYSFQVLSVYIDENSDTMAYATVYLFRAYLVDKGLSSF